jgi:hypothetical protein
MSNEPDLVAAHADRLLPLAGAALTDDYYYQSLPLCAIDAVYSIGVRYEGVRAVVLRYCERTEQRRVRPDRHTLPPREEQESISAFCERFDRTGLEAMTADIFANRQRTSSRGGILKAEAVHRFARAMRAHGAEHLQDVPTVADNVALERDVRSIPGQGSGISFQYFWMLAGSDEFIKPDRMVLRFLQSALGRAVTVGEAQGLLSSAAERLRTKYPHIKPRLLDYVIWQYQRQQLVDSIPGA